MDRIIALVFDPIFWFATVGIGLILSVFANFITDGIKRIWGSVSARQRERNKKEKERIEYLGRLCAANPSYLSIRLGDVAWYQLEANSFSIVASIILLVLLAITSAITPDWLFRVMDLDFVLPSSLPPFDPFYIVRFPITSGRFWLFLFVQMTTVLEFYLLYLSYKFRNSSKYNMRIVNHARRIIQKELEASIKSDQDDR